MSRVLLVEDDEHLAEGLAFNLRNNGYEVLSVETGEEACDAVEQGRFDLILLDVMLPGINGVEVVRRIRRAGNTSPVLMLTARSRADEAVAGLDAGADDYITKPFDIKEVLARIRGALRRQAWTGVDRKSAAEPKILRYGRWSIDFSKFVAVDSEGNEQRLTATEAGRPSCARCGAGRTPSRPERWTISCASCGGCSSPTPPGRATSSRSEARATGSFPDYTGETLSAERNVCPCSNCAVS